MQPGLGEVAGDVDPDPGAVFEAHDADSVDELVADGSAPDPEPAGDDGVDRLFEDGLDRPEPTADAGRDRTTNRASESTGEEPRDATATDVLAALEETATENAPEPTESDDLGGIDDGEVEDALAAAEAIDDADAAESVPVEWQDR